MAKFKPKKIIRDVKEFYKNNPTAKITTTTAGFSGTNLAINATRKILIKISRRTTRSNG